MKNWKKNHSVLINVWKFWCFSVFVSQIRNLQTHKGCSSARDFINCQRQGVQTHYYHDSYQFVFKTDKNPKAPVQYMARSSSCQRTSEQPILPLTSLEFGQGPSIFESQANSGALDRPWDLSNPRVLECSRRHELNAGMVTLVSTTPFFPTSQLT